MADKKFKFSDDELKLIKRTFEGNDELLMTVKKIMLQLELTEAEDIAHRKAFKDNSELIRVLRKFFLPTLDDKNVEVDQMTDMWSILGREINFRDRRLEDVWVHLVVGERVIDYLDKQLVELGGGEKNIRIFKNFVIIDNDSREETFIYILARNLILARVESVIGKIGILANVKEESEEERLKRETANSNQ